MRLLDFEPPYPLHHTLNLDHDLGGTEIDLAIANQVLASMAFKYDLPAGGTLVSPKHVLEGQEVWLEDLCPAIFSQVFPTLSCAAHPHQRRFRSGQFACLGARMQCTLLQTCFLDQYHL